MTTSQPWPAGVWLLTPVKNPGQKYTIVDLQSKVQMSKGSKDQFCSRGNFLSQFLAHSSTILFPL